LIKGQTYRRARAGARPTQRARAHNSPTAEHFLLCVVYAVVEDSIVLLRISRSRETASAIVVTPFWIGWKLSMIASNNQTISPVEVENGQPHHQRQSS
jgi:hypothetical protein